MAQKIDVNVNINDKDASSKVSKLEHNVYEFKRNAETPVKIRVDTTSIKDAEGNLKKLVETTKYASGQIEAVTKKAGNVTATSKTDKDNADAIERRMRNLEAFMRLKGKVAEEAKKAEEKEAAAAKKSAQEQEQAHRQKMRNLQEQMRLSETIERTTNKAASLYAKGDMQGYEAAIQYLKELGVAVDEAAIKEKALQISTEDAGKRAEDAAKRANKASKAFGLLHTIFLRLAHTAISQMTRAFRQAITEMQNVDKQLTTVSRVTQTSISSLEGLKQKAYEVGSAYGVMASDYLSAAAAFSRAGYREQAEDLAELSSKLQIAGQVSADVANQLLIATDKAYGLNGSVTELSSVMDKMTVIDHNYATSVEKIAEGMGLVAPIASQAHMTIDELIAAMGTITAVTQRGGSESARALRALILSIIKDTTTEIEDGVTWTVEEINTLQDALKTYAPEVVKAAEATKTLIDPMEAIASLSKAYEEGVLTETKLAEITSKLGGKLRSSQLLSLIQNYSGMYTDMLNQMQSATGAVDKDIEKSLESWEVKIKQLKNTFTEFVEKSLSSDFFKGMLDAVKWLIEGFGSLGTVVGLLGAAFVALNISRVINWFTQLGSSVKALGGGFKAVITVLANYKTASKAGAVGTEAFNTALKGTSFAASAATVAIGALVAIISIAIIAYNKAKQAEEQRREAQIQSAKTAAQEASELQKVKANYDELKKSFEEGKIKREDYESAQQAIIDKLKAEGFWADDTSVKYKKLTEAIEAQTKAALESRKAEILTGLRGARSAVDDALYTDTVIKLNIDESIDKAVTWLSKGGMGKNIPSWILTGIDSLGLSPYDRLRDQTGSLRRDVVFGSDEETRVLRAIELYYTLKDALVALSEAGKDETDEFKFVGDAIGTLEPEVKEYVDTAYELFDLLDENELSEYESRGGIWGYLIGKYREGNPTVDTVKDEADETAKSIKGLSDELDNATKALDKYKKALEGGEKGDALKSYAEAYKKAVEMYEKGLTGSNQYMSAIDLLFGNVDDYEAAGKLLGNAFVKAMFEGGGEDYGANAANYIRKHRKDFEENGVEITEGENGTFGLVVTDMEKFAEYTNLSTDALWTLIDALDIFHSKTTYTRDQLFNFMGLEDNGTGGLVNLTKVINELAGQGKSAREIKDIVDAIKELAETDGNIEIDEPENLDQTINDIVELNKEAEKGTEFEVVITSNKDEFFGGIYKEIKNLDGTTIYIGLKTVGHSSSGVSKKDVFKFWQAERNASGTKSARGGLSLVNEEGAEIIYANGKAWIAGGGDPTITNLPAGAGVFTAKETREILTRSGIESHSGTYVGGIPIGDIIASGGSGKAGKGKLTEDLLQQIADYINDILKKAKEALQEQLDAIDEQIEKLKREHDAEEDANKLEELRLKILEAEKKLAEAEQERTVRYFNKETGQWEWMADQKAVADAQKELQDARDAYDKEVAEQAYQAQLQALEDQKDSLNDAYNELSDGWEKIYEELENILNEKGAVDIAKLLATLLGTQGGGYAPDIQALIDAIGAFTANPTSVLDTDTTERIMSLNSSSGGATPVLSAMLGSGSYDLNGRGQSTFGGNTSIVGDTIYYINGVQIGSDMMDKPLSQILSVLPIYAN